MSINPLDGLRWQNEPSTPTENKQSLEQEDFFKLLSQQMAQQDPFKPVDNDQMISQMSSFATVDGIQQLNDEISSLNSITASNQALQASSLVGQKVLIPSANVSHDANLGASKGIVSVGEPVSEVTVRVENEQGQLVDTFSLNAQAGGNVEFNWQGIDSNGDPLPPGIYQFKAQTMLEGEQTSLPVSSYAHVSSVTLGGAGNATILNLRGMGGINLADVLAVAEA